MAILTAHQRAHLYDYATEDLDAKGYEPTPERAECARRAVAVFQVIGWTRIEKPLAKLPRGLTVEELEDFRRFMEDHRQQMEEAVADYEAKGTPSDVRWAKAGLAGAKSALAAVVV